MKKIKSSETVEVLTLVVVLEVITDVGHVEWLYGRDDICVEP